MLAAFRRTLIVGATALAVLPASADAARSLYALSTGGAPADRQISHFAIGADRSLTPVGVTPLGADAPRDLAMTPDGRHLFVSFDGPGGEGGVRSFEVLPGGGLGADTRVVAGHSSGGVAISPDGRFLYLGDDGEDAVRTFAIGAGGSLTQVGSAAAGGGTDVVVGEDGTHVYAASSWTYDVSVYPVSGDGSLGAATATTPPGFATPTDLTLVPQFDRLLVGDASQQPTAFSIAANGSLSSGFAVPAGGFSSGAVQGGPSPWEDFAFTVGDGVPNDTLKSFMLHSGPNETGSISLGPDDGVALAVTADARTVYVRGNTSRTVRTFAVAEDGTLSERGTGVPVPLTQTLYGAMVVAPDQPPAASFTVRTNGSTVTVDGSATTDPEGGPIRYDWDFGDGTVLRDGGPVVSHDYGDYGTFEVSLIAADDQLCHTGRWFTGSTVACNGGAGAYATRTVTYAPVWTPGAAAGPASVPVLPVPSADPGPAAVAPRLEGTGEGRTRASRAGRVRLPALEAVCPAGAGPCDDGEVALNATIGGERVTLGRAPFAVAEGQRARIALRLPAAGQRLLRRERAVEVTAVVRLRSAATTAQAQRSVTFTLRAPKRRG